MLGRNVRHRRKEIDLVVRRGSVVAFVEVKGRRDAAVGHPLEALYRQVRSLRLAEGASDVLRLNLAKGALELDKGRI